MLSCGQRNTGITSIDVNVEALPLVHGEDIVGLVSDSGVVIARITTKVQDTYSNDTASYWFFPQGIFVEKFDSLFQVNARVWADTAYYFDRIALWQLIGNVKLENTVGTICETSELFWNSREPPASMQAIYSEKFVKITEPTKVHTTIGFKANQSVTKYTLYKNTLDMEIDEANSAEE